MDRSSQQIVIVGESTRGTAEAVDLATDNNLEIYELDEGQRDFGHTGGMEVADGTTRKSKSYSGKKTATRSFKVDFLAGADIQTAPVWWHKLLKGMCGWVVTDGHATDPATAEYTGRPECNSATMLLPLWGCGQAPTGKGELMAGCAATFDIEIGTSGDLIQPKFTVSGKYGGKSDLTTFSVPAGYDARECAQFLGSVFQIGATAYNVWGMTISFGGNIVPYDKQGDVTNGIKTGVGYFKVGNANPQITFKVDQFEDDTNGLELDVINNVVHPTLTFDIGICEIEFGVVQPTDDQSGTENETVSSEITCKVDTIKFTQK
ncbi:MAG: hypothetical protein GY774_00300 [Planctomycetes bacterium]|nr:hypothetical protein [Planctomycetota bacterium]